MSNQEPPQRYSDGPLGSPDEIPSGICPARYQISVVVTADILKSLEAIAYMLGMSKPQIDAEVFGKGYEAVRVELLHARDADLHAILDTIAPLGQMVRESQPEW